MFRPNIISDLCYVFSKATKRWIETEKLPKKLKNTAKVISWAKIKQWLTLLMLTQSLAVLSLACQDNTPFNKLIGCDTSIWAGDTRLDSIFAGWMDRDRAHRFSLCLWQSDWNLEPGG